MPSLTARSKVLPGRSKGKTRLRHVIILPSLLALAFNNPLQAQPETLDDLLQLSLEELADLRVTSVSKRAESISNAAASIFVITADDIYRSGATTLPEVLRLAPNLQVARIDSVRYAISARGFNNSIGNKLLVLIDGRTAYTSMFSGVFWEMQDTLLQDIERIEIISGPGATLWGANAVNGVINVTTRSASASTNTLAAGELGDRERGIAARTGGTTENLWHWRFYAKTRDWDNTRQETGTPVRDNLEKQQIGFRFDREQSDSSLTFQGDAHQGKSEHRGIIGPFEIPALEIAGMNLLARWNKQLTNDSDLRIQAYWNQTKREEIIIFSPKADTFDLELLHSFSHNRHRILWGGGYRRSRDDVDPGFFTAILPDSRSLSWENIFVQDEFSLHTTLKATAGIKLEWNDYTGMEYLPSFRLGWDATDQHFVWAAVSRAVRAPSRYDRDAYFPQTAPFIVAGGPNFVAEVAKVYELGYRSLFGDHFSLSATLFHHDWDKLRSGTPLPLPTFLANGIEGNVNGVEAWLNWQLRPRWRLSGGMTSFDKDLAFSPGNSDTAGINNATLHNDPDYQWLLRSSMDIGQQFKLDLNLRRVSELNVEPVPGYTELNARFAWAVSPRLELTLTGNNLLHNDHAEFGLATSRSRMDRSILLGFRWMP